MGLIGRFEKGLDRAVNGVFAKAFRSEVQPVEIASKLRRECDDRATPVTRERTITPNTFVVELGKADHERLGDWEQALGKELATAVSEHARQQHYSFVGPVRVTFEEADDLDTGVFRIRSLTVGPGEDPGLAGPPEPIAEAGPHVVHPPVVPDAPPAMPPAPVAYRPPPPPGQQVGAARLDVAGRAYPLTSPVTVIGRSTDADIVLEDPGVSRRHAEVRLVDGRPRVIDLGSTNGTFVDGERVHAGNLAEGSTITVGRTRIVYRGGDR